jgi:hypothetical protein
MAAITADTLTLPRLPHLDDAATTPASGDEGGHGRALPRRTRLDVHADHTP